MTTCRVFTCRILLLELKIFPYGFMCWLLCMYILSILLHICMCLFRIYQENTSTSTSQHACSLFHIYVCIFCKSLLMDIHLFEKIHTHLGYSKNVITADLFLLYVSFDGYTSLLTNFTHISESPKKSKQLVCSFCRSLLMDIRLF